MSDFEIIHSNSLLYSSQFIDFIGSEGGGDTPTPPSVDFPVTFDGLTTVYASSSSFSDTVITSEHSPHVNDRGVYRVTNEPQREQLSDALTAGWFVNKTFPDLVTQFEFECEFTIPNYSSINFYGQLLGYAGSTSSKRYYCPVVQIFQNKVTTNASVNGRDWHMGDTNPVNWKIGDTVHLIYTLAKLEDSNTTLNKRLQVSINGADFVDIVNKNYGYNHIVTPKLLSLFFSNKDTTHNVFAGNIFMKKTKLTVNNEVFINCAS